VRRAPERARVIVGEAELLIDFTQDS